MTATPPRLLTIAGSDSGGGAGLQADLKTFAAHGVYGFSVVTAVTAQNTRGVTAVHPVPVEVVTAQLDAVFDDIGADAVKLGMLGTVELVHGVAAGLRRHARDLPIVLDPVMVAQSGDPLIDDAAVTALAEELLPLATVVTPNLPEARRLTGLALAADASEGERFAAGQLIAAMADGGAVLIKAGHAAGDQLVDCLVDADGDRHRFAHPRIDTTSSHGTGCTLASAIAARLGRGDALVDAVGGAIDYLQEALRTAFPLGRGAGPVHHFHRLSRDATA
ncbi:MAG: bifunctional hydroxymethylpyrimidine kinase/phosphomethylpyrimidine kinase [Acidobacteriota bacterium]